MWTAPFRRAPFLLFRHGVVWAAVFGAGVIVGLVAALTPQFVSSSASEALRRELNGRCSASYAGTFEASAWRFGGQSVFFPVNPRTQQLLGEAAADIPNLGEPFPTIVGQTVSARVADNPQVTVPLVIMHRGGFRDHVNLLRGGDRPGVWIEQFAADQLGVDVGDEIAYRLPLEADPRGVEGRLPVAAVIDDLSGRHNEDYWCGIYPLLAPGPFGDRPPPLALVDVDVFGAARFPDAPAETFLRNSEEWEIPVELEGITLIRAGEVLGAFERIGETLLGDPERIESDIRPVRERVVAMAEALGTSLRPLGLAVLIAALGLMAGAGSYWVDRRTQELRLLTVYGYGSVAVGLKAALESLIPIALGVTSGALSARPLAALVGPGGAIEPSATTTGLRAAIPSGAAAILLVAVVATVRSRGILETRQRRRIAPGWWRLPTVVGLAGLVVWVRDRIGDDAVVFGAADLVGHVDPLVILYPLLVSTGAALVAAQLTLGLVRIVKRARVKGHAAYLAVRRIGASPTTAVAIVAGTLIPIATLVYAASLTRSTETTVQAKARTFIGADVRTPIYRLEPLPARLEEASTLVRRAERVEFAGATVELLAIDTETFARGAFWDPRLADRPLDELLGILEKPGPELAAIVANADPPAQTGVIQVGRYQIPIRVEATASSFPGARRDRPIVVISQRRLDAIVETADPTGPRGRLTDYLWTSGLDAETVEAELRTAGVGFAFTTTAEETLDLTRFQAVIWTFALLQVYAGLAGVIVVAGILLYADTRQRARNLSYALARRMGLTRGQHMAASLIEMAGLTLVGALTGAVAAALAAGTVYRSLDPLPQTPPGPLAAATTDVALLLVVLTLGVAGAASWIAQRVADTADVSELLRHGG